MVSKTLAFLLAALAATPALAVPPPPEPEAAMLALAPDGCPLEVSGSARPYSPVVYRFAGAEGDVLVMVSARPSLDLTFDLGRVGEAPLISDAGFGPDVRIRLPHEGAYELQLSGYDPIGMKAVPADFRLKLYLRREGSESGCA